MTLRVAVPGMHKHRHKLSARYPHRAKVMGKCCHLPVATPETRSRPGKRARSDLSCACPFDGQITLAVLQSTERITSCLTTTGQMSWKTHEKMPLTSRISALLQNPVESVSPPNVCAAGVQLPIRAWHTILQSRPIIREGRSSCKMRFRLF
jgi:hypothetical protein